MSLKIYAISPTTYSAKPSVGERSRSHPQLTLNQNRLDENWSIGQLISGGFQKVQLMELMNKVLNNQVIFIDFFIFAWVGSLGLPVNVSQKKLKLLAHVPRWHWFLRQRFQCNKLCFPGLFLYFRFHWKPSNSVSFVSWTKHMTVLVKFSIYCLCYFPLFWVL